MMNSSSREAASQAFSVPITTFLYRDMRDMGLAHERDMRRGDATGQHEDKPNAPRGPSAQEVAEIVNRTRAEAVAETEARLQLAYQARVEAQSFKIQGALEAFANEQKNYFSRVETEVVQLALTIAAKILHREAQVDPLLVAALVRVAVDKLHDGSKVTVRVSPLEVARWRGVLANPSHGSALEVVEDHQLGADDCVLETDLGSANFSLDAQLKEVEQGFFDLLAQRPVIK